MTTPRIIPTEDDPLRSVEYVARVLEFDEGTIRQWLRDEKIRGTKVAGQWRIAQSELNRFVNQEYGENA